MITHDIQRFSTHLAAIYSNLAKPVLDVILYNYQLSQNVGVEALVCLTLAVQSTAVLCVLFPDHQLTLLRLDCSSHSAVSDTSFRYLYSPIRQIGRVTSTYTFTINWVFWRDRIHERRACRTLTDWKRVCNHVETRKKGVGTTVVVRLCGRRCYQMALGFLRRMSYLCALG